MLEEAERLDVAVHRVSQGSGVFMLTDEELDRYALVAAMARVEVSLFARPNAAWGPSATTLTPAGGSLAAAARGQDQVVDCAEDILRAAAHGIRSVLIGDLGVLALFGEMKRAGVLPEAMQAKVSVMLPAANPLTAKGARRPRRGHAQPADRPRARADRRHPAGRRRPARRVRRGAGGPGRLRAAAHDPGAGPRSPLPSTSSSGCATAPTSTRADSTSRRPPWP